MKHGYYVCLQANSGYFMFVLYLNRQRNARKSTATAHPYSRRRHSNVVSYMVSVTLLIFIPICIRR